MSLFAGLDSVRSRSRLVQYYKLYVRSYSVCVSIKYCLCLHCVCCVAEEHMSHRSSSDVWTTLPIAVSFYGGVWRRASDARSVSCDIT